MESQELAKVLGILVAYLSQLERSIRTNSSAELLDKITMVLCLNKIETETLYDLYAKVSGRISPDMVLAVSTILYILALAIYVSFAQVESESISKNVSWVKQKRLCRRQDFLPIFQASGISERCRRQARNCDQ